MIDYDTWLYEFRKVRDTAGLIDLTTASTHRQIKERARAVLFSELTNDETPRIGESLPIGPSDLYASYPIVAKPAITGYRFTFNNQPINVKVGDILAQAS